MPKQLLSYLLVFRKLLLLITLWQIGCNTKYTVVLTSLSSHYLHMYQFIDWLSLKVHLYESPSNACKYAYLYAEELILVFCLKEWIHEIVKQNRYCVSVGFPVRRVQLNVPQWAFGAKMTSSRRQCDVIMSHRR